jgi:DNA-binding transcriptional ArsR family regulator
MPEHTRHPHKSNAVQRALAHPVRAQILSELEKRAASPSQLADVVGESVGVVSYHVRVLAEAGLTELVGTVPKRGALQHFYAVRDSDTLGVTVMLDAERAEALRRDLRDRVAEARRSAEAQPGEVPVTVVVHALD